MKERVREREREGESVDKASMMAQLTRLVRDY